MTSADARFGRACKRLFGDRPVRFRRSATPFLLNDTTDDARAGALVRDKRVLQFVASDETPSLLCVDVDTLHGHDVSKNLVDTPHGVRRARAAARLLTAVVEANFGIELHWFASGKQGLHGFGLGVSLSKRHRVALAKALLPRNSSEARELFDRWVHLYEHESVRLVVETTLAELVELDTTADAEWSPRLNAALAPAATMTDKLLAITAFFDRGPTTTGSLRVPCSFNEKGFYGFPLPPVGDEWPTLRRPAGAATRALSDAELELLEAIPMTATDPPAALQRLDCLLKRQLEEDAEESSGTNERDIAYIPRFSTTTRRILPAEGTDARLALIPAKVRPYLSAECIRALECGIERGGVPPSLWLPEPNTERRIAFCSYGGGLGNDPALPLSLLLLTGLQFHYEAQVHLARSMLVSHFPIDCTSRAFHAQRHELYKPVRFASWFETFSKNNHTFSALGFNVTSGRYEPVRRQSPVVQKMCREATDVLRGRVGEREPSVVTPRGSVAAKSHNTPARRFTGRVVQLRLDRAAASVLDSARPALEMLHEGGDAVHRAELSLQHLYANASADGTVRFLEFVGTDSRLGYVCDDGYAGVKSIHKELRHELFRGHYAHSVDIHRSHCSMLVGAHARAVELGLAPPNADLERIANHFEQFEAELAADQLRQLPAAQARATAAKSDSERTHSAKLVQYLRAPAKIVLSVCLNHPDDSPMFRNWPFAQRLQRALSIAARAALAHPMVRADPNRPAGFGGKGEKSRICCILERRALEALITAAERAGAGPGLTLNDELFVRSVPASGVAAFESELTSAVRGRLGFDIRVRVRAVGV